MSAPRFFQDALRRRRDEMAARHDLAVAPIDRDVVESCEIADREDDIGDELADREDP